MPTPEYHLRYLSVCLENLEDYLLSSTLFWPLGISSPPEEQPYPQMTIGNMLVERSLLAALPEGETSLRDIEKKLEQLRSKWRVAWETKVEVEIASRLRQWREWLNDESAPGALAPGPYRSGIRLRLMLELLGEENAKAAEMLGSEVKALDRKLRAMIEPGDFVWDAQYQAGFPADRFWYLYVKM